MKLMIGETAALATTHRAVLTGKILLNSFNKNIQDTSIGFKNMNNNHVNSNKSTTVSSSKNNSWGPTLVICKGKDLKPWEESFGVVLGDKILDPNFQKEKNLNEKLKSFKNDVNFEKEINIIGYYGSDMDREFIRSYMFDNNGVSTLYADRSPCHVIIANYEAILSDLQFFEGRFMCKYIFLCVHMDTCFLYVYHY